MQKRQGIIYDYNWEKASGEVIIAIVRGATFAYKATKVIASTLIVVGLSGFLLSLKPVVETELSYRLSQATGVSEKVQKQNEEILVKAAQKELDEREEVQKMAQELEIPNTKFSIYVPKIGAKAPITQNVSVANQNEYMTALKEGVAHASGSVFPGMEGTTYLFAHSSDNPWGASQYNTIFYLLRELEAKTIDDIPLGGGKMDKEQTIKNGDEIHIFFLDKLYTYQVTEKHVVDAKDLSWLLNARTGSERLVLQTCWPPGTDWKRLIVVAEPVK